MTDWHGLVLHRARAAGTLLATLFALVAVTTAMIAGVLGQSATLATQAARSALAASDVGLQVTARLAPDPAAQDLLARDALASGFAPAPVVTWSSSFTEPQRAQVAGRELPGRVVLSSGQLFDDGITITDGVAPNSPGEAALQASAATELGVKVGDTVTASSVSLQVTGLWRVTDPTAQRWLGDPLVTGGSDAAGVGPLLVDVSVLAKVGDPYARWTVLPAIDRIATSDLAPLVAGAGRAATATSAAADVAGRGVTVTGDLSSAAKEAATARALGDGFRLVPVGMLLLVAVVGLVQVASLMSAARRRETALLFARGASLRQVAGVGVLEAMVISVVGSLLGTAVATAVVGMLSGTLAHLGAIVEGGLLGLLIATLCLGGVAVQSAIQADRDGAGVAERLASVAGAATLVLVLALAGLATWLLRRQGRFLTVEDGAVSTDLLAALAPALLVATTAVLVLLALAPLTRVLGAFTRRAPVTPWLAGAQLGRALRLHAVPVVLTALATSLATFSAFFAGGSAALAQDLAVLRQGAPLRATLASAADPHAPALTLPGVGLNSVVRPTPVWFTDAGQIGNLALPILAAPTESLAAIASLPAGAELPTLSPKGHGSGVAVPTGTSALEVTMEATSLLLTPVRVSLRLRDNATGQVTWIDSGPLTPSTDGSLSHRATVPLSQGADATIDAVRVTASSFDTLTARVSVAAAQGGLLLTKATYEWDAHGDEQTASLLPSRQPDPVPIALTTASAASAALSVGDPLTVAAFGQHFPAVVAAIIDNLPGVSDGTGALVDSVALARATVDSTAPPLRPTQLWAAVDGAPETARAALAAEAGVDSVASAAAPAQFGSTGAAASSLQIAAIGAMILALTGVAAASATQLRSRRPEVAVLRALAMTPRAQAVSRAFENGVALVLAGVAGIVGGVAVAALTIRPLALSTGVTGAHTVHLIADWPPLLALLGAGMFAAAAIVGVVSAAVTRQALDVNYREEVR